MTGRAGERGATGLLLCQGGDAEQLHEQRHQRAVWRAEGTSEALRSESTSCADLFLWKGFQRIFL